MRFEIDLGEDFQQEAIKNSIVGDLLEYNRYRELQIKCNYNYFMVTIPNLALYFGLTNEEVILLLNEINPLVVKKEKEVVYSPKEVLHYISKKILSQNKYSFFNIRYAESILKLNSLIGGIIESVKDDGSIETQVVINLI